MQRVILKTSAGAYSMLQELTNHSFQGLAEGTPSQSRFTELNVKYFRTLLKDEIESGVAEEILSSNKTNFASKATSLPEMNPYVVSEGSMGSQMVQFVGGLFGLMFVVPQAGATAATLTYQQVVDGLGLTRGDQITFLCLSTDDSEGTGKFNGFRYARVILEPSDGDMSSTFFADGAINKPNARNEGNISLAFVPVAGDVPAHLTFSIEGIDTAAGKVNSVAAATVIASRLVGGTWQRSKQSLVMRPDTVSVTGHLQWEWGIDYLADAIASYMTMTESSLYLNQAENF
ncbi:MAG: hypothetical protein U0K36_05675 [Bacteroidales bacterium]|nr:hypothetical protein [Bacteroidales bacterium]